MQADTSHKHDVNPVLTDEHIHYADLAREVFLQLTRDEQTAVIEHLHHLKIEAESTAAVLQKEPHII